MNCICLNAQMGTKQTRQANIRLLIKQRFNNNKGQFADAIGRPRPNISRLLSENATDRRGVGEDLARDIELRLSLPSGWLDTPQTASEKTTHTASEPSPTYKTPVLRPIQTWENEDELDPDKYVFIPSLDIKLSAGNGNVVWEVDQKGQKQAFTAKWIKRMGIDPACAATMVADGSSMAPRILDGDSLVVDYCQQNILDGKVYAIAVMGEVYVKRLFKEFDGGIRIVSDNPDKIEYPDRFISPDASKQLEIIGRIVAVSGGI